MLEVQAKVIPPWDLIYQATTPWRIWEDKSAAACPVPGSHQRGTAKPEHEYNSPAQRQTSIVSVITEASISSDGASRSVTFQPFSLTSRILRACPCRLLQQQQNTDLTISSPVTSSCIPCFCPKLAKGAFNDVKRSIPLVLHSRPRES